MSQAQDWAWAAGFIDGEGCFQLYEKGGGQRIIRPLISVSQSMTREPLDKLVRIFGGTVVKATRLTSTGRPVWIWNLTSAQAMRKVLPLVIPHLTAKRQEAEIFLRFAKLMRVRGEPGWNKPLTKEELNQREEIAQELRRIKMNSTTTEGGQ